MDQPLRNCHIKTVDELKANLGKDTVAHSEKHKKASEGAFILHSVYTPPVDQMIIET